MANLKPLSTLTPDLIDSYISEFETEIQETRANRDALLATCMNSQSTLDKLEVYLSSLLRVYDELIKLKSTPDPITQNTF